MLRSMFMNRFVLVTAALLLCQQTLVAASTFVMAEIVASIEGDASFIWWLGALLVTLSVPYVFSALAFRSAVNIKQVAYKMAMKMYDQAVHGRTSYIGNEREREQRFVFMTKEGGDVIAHAVDSGVDFVQTGLNVALNIGAIASVVSGWFLGAYAVSISLIFLISYLAKSPLTKSTSSTRSAQLQLDSVNLRSWENLVIGNKMNVEAWRKRQSRSLDSFYSSFFGLVSIREFANALSAILSILPVAALVFFQAHYASSKAEVLLLIATLPRQLIILNHLGILGSYSNLLHEMRERLNGLVLAMTPDQSTNAAKDAASRIDFARMTATLAGQDISLTSVEDTVRLFKAKPLGLISLRGTNGAGKSTLLRYIKEAVGAAAFYLPADTNDLEFKAAESLSSGQRAVAILEAIAQDPDIRLLLLDEWDANLDANRRSEALHLIEEISRRILIVEVSHRTAHG